MALPAQSECRRRVAATPLSTPAVLRSALGGLCIYRQVEARFDHLKYEARVEALHVGCIQEQLVNDSLATWHAVRGNDDQIIPLSSKVITLLNLLGRAQAL